MHIVELKIEQDYVHGIGSLLVLWQKKELWTASLESGAYLRQMLGETTSLSSVMVLWDIFWLLSRLWK